MNAYVYRVGLSSHLLLIEQFEGHLLVGLSPFANSDSGVLVVHESGIVRNVERPVLADKVRSFWAFLLAQEESIQYSYGLAFEGCVPTGSSGGQSCSFNGERAIVSCGPGYCHIVATDFTAFTEEEMVALAKKNGFDRAILRGTPMHATRRTLHDLRDMQSVALGGENGGPKGVRATRRRKPTAIVRKLAGLLAFLESSTAATVEVSVVQRYKPPG